MCSVLCLRILFALFPAYVSCLGNYEGNVPPANVHEVPAHTFPEIGPEVKQVENRIDSSVRLLHTQDTDRHSNSYQNERLSEASNVKNDCQTLTVSDNQGNMINQLSASVPNHKFLGFGQYESRTATPVFRNVQPVKQFINTFSQGGSNTFRGESSYEVPKSSTVGSSKIFDYIAFKPQVTRDKLGGPNQAQSTVSNQVSYHHGSSQGNQSVSKVKAASSTYSPIPIIAPVHFSNNPRKPSNSVLKYAESKPSIVSSGPIFVLKGSEVIQGLGSYNKHPNDQKTHGVQGNVGFSQYVTPQTGQTSSVALNIDYQPSKSWKYPPHYSVSGGQYSAGPKPLKMSGSDCKDGVGKLPIASSGAILLKATQRVKGRKSFPHYESNGDVQHPEIFQKTYNTRGLFQNRSPVFSVSGSQPKQNLKPMHPIHPSGAQYNVAKSSIASSGAIRVVPGPVSAQSGPQSQKLQVISEPHARLPFSQTALQPSIAKQNSGDVQPTTGTYARPTQSGYQVFSSFMGTSYKPGSAPSYPQSAKKSSISDSEEINAIHVRLNKKLLSSFGNSQNQLTSGDYVGTLSANSGTFQSFMPSSHLGQRQGQHAQTPVRPSVSQYHGSEKVQSLSVVTQENSDSAMHEITTIPSEFGKGVIRRLSPMISGSYITAPQNQVQRVDFSAPGCEVIQNLPSGLGQPGPAGNFQGVKRSSRSASQCLL